MLTGLLVSQCLTFMSAPLSLSLCTELHLIFFKNSDAVINRPIDWSVGGALTPVDL